MKEVTNFQCAESKLTRRGILNIPRSTSSKSGAPTSEPNQMQEKCMEPAGFCPVCKYPMDVGRCPECGTIVGEVALITPATLKKRKRHRRLLCIAALLVVVAAAGWAAHKSRVDLYHYFPNAVLFPFSENTKSRAAKELADRFINGKMSTPDAEKFLNRVKHMRSSCRSPRPAELPVCIKIDSYMKAPYDEFLKCSLGDLSLVKLPGMNTFVRSQRKNTSVEALSITNEGSRECILPQLKEGNYQIDFEHDVVVQSSPWCPKPLPLLPYSTTASGSINVVIEDRPLSDYVKPAWSEEIRDSLLKSCVLKVLRNPKEQNAVCCISHSRIGQGLSWNIWVRYHPNTPFVKLSGHVVGRPGEYPDHPNIDENIVNDETIDNIDLCLIPDLFGAFENGLDDIFAGIIEWSNVPVDNEVNNKTPGLYPTNIREWNGETEPRPEWCLGGADGTPTTE